MPNRILRSDFVSSETLNGVSERAELAFLHLITVVDDFGRCEASVRILRPKLFPLRLTQISEEDLTERLAECERAGLFITYQVDGKKYIQLLKINPPRAAKSKWPAPPADVCTCAQVKTSDSDVPYSGSGSGSSSNTTTTTTTNPGSGGLRPPAEPGPPGSPSARSSLRSRGDRGGATSSSPEGLTPPSCAGSPSEAEADQKQDTPAKQRPRTPEKRKQDQGRKPAGKWASWDQKKPSTPAADIRRAYAKCWKKILPGLMPRMSAREFEAGVDQLLQERDSDEQWTASDVLKATLGALWCAEKYGPAEPGGEDNPTWKCQNWGQGRPGLFKLLGKIRGELRGLGMPFGQDTDHVLVWWAKVALKARTAPDAGHPCGRPTPEQEAEARAEAGGHAAELAADRERRRRNAEEFAVANPPRRRGADPDADAAAHEPPAAHRIQPAKPAGEPPGDVSDSDTSPPQLTTVVTSPGKVLGADGKDVAESATSPATTPPTPTVTNFREDQWLDQVLTGEALSVLEPETPTKGTP